MDLIKILHRHSTTKNKVPNLDELNRREVAVAHVNNTNRINAVIGLFIRTGSAINNNSNDKIKRIGGIIITDNGLRPDQIVTNGSNIDWSGEQWLDKSVDPHILYMNIDGLTTGWRQVAAITP